MHKSEVNQIIWGTLFSAIFLMVFIFWAETDKQSLHSVSLEDGPIESMSALFYFLSSICFLIAAKRSDFLKNKQTGFRYLMILAWAVLMLIFAGEEVSWGQRIFEIETPTALAELNVQNEINIHNMELINTLGVGKYRYLSIMMLMTGLLIPLIMLIAPCRRFMQWIAYPVAPLCYWLIFVGSYIYGKVYYNNLVFVDDASEIREFILSVGMMLVSLHGAIYPCVFFRSCDT